MTRSHSEPLSPREYRRYARQLTLPQVGIPGQTKLKHASVMLVGVGGLGSPVLQYLAAAGVGRIGLVDADEVDESNLHRQVMFDYDCIGQPKVKAAANKAAKLNPDINIETHQTRLHSDNALALIEQYDLVIDCSDNFQTRYLVNDACVILNKPYIYSSIYQFEGLLTLFADPKGPCYRCAFPEPPPQGLVPNCAEGGVLGVLPGVFGTLQAAEAVKYLLGYGNSLAGRLMQINLLDTKFSEFELPKNPNCQACSDPKSLKLEESEPTVQCELPTQGSSINAKNLQQLLQTQNGIKLLDVRSDKERAITKLDDDLHIPLNELESADLDVAQDEQIVAYCVSGIRSKQAVEILNSRGYTNVKSLIGGVLAWNSLDN